MNSQLESGNLQKKKKKKKELDAEQKKISSSGEQ